MNLLPYPLHLTYQGSQDGVSWNTTSVFVGMTGVSGGASLDSYRYKRLLIGSFRRRIIIEIT